MFSSLRLRSCFLCRTCAMSPLSGARSSSLTVWYGFGFCRCSTLAAPFISLDDISCWPCGLTIRSCLSRRHSRACLSNRCGDDHLRVTCLYTDLAFLSRRSLLYSYWKLVVIAIWNPTFYKDWLASSNRVTIATFFFVARVPVWYHACR